MTRSFRVRWLVLLFAIAGFHWLGLAAAAQEKKTKIVLVGTKPDHPPGTHLYQFESRLLAKCLQETPGIEAVVAQDWPNAQTLEGARAIVYYSRPAGDIVLAEPHRQVFQKMMAEGVGFTAIHWGTGANKQNGPDYLKILGGWFHPGSGIKFAKAKLVQIDPKHPICRGWSGCDWNDEYYLNLDFHPQTKPLVKVSVDGKEQVVAWVLNRPDSQKGRSFGTTLGHSHENFTHESFRRLLVNGILWTARVRIPRTGAPCALSAEDLEVPAEGKPK